MQNQSSATTTTPTANAIGVLALLGAVGSLLMTVGHLGVAVPGLADLAGRRLVPVAVGFAVATVAYLTVAWAVFTRRGWAWPAAVVLNALALVAAGMPFRGLFSGVAMTVSAVALVLLVSPSGRSELRG